MRTIARSIIGAALTASLIAAPAPVFASSCGDIAGNPSFETDSGDVAEECDKQEPPQQTPPPPPPTKEPTPVKETPKPTPKPEPEPKPKPAPKPTPQAPAPKPTPKPAPQPKPPVVVQERPQPAPPVVRTPRPQPPAPPRPVVRDPRPRNATPPSRPVTSMDKVCVAEITLKVKGKQSITFKVRNRTGKVLRTETVAGNSREVVRIKLRGQGPWKFVVTAPGYRKAHREPACDCTETGATATGAAAGSIGSDASPAAAASISGALPEGTDWSRILLGVGIATLLGAGFLATRRRKTVEEAPAAAENDTTEV